MWKLYIGLAIGFGAGYFAANKVVKRNADLILNEEIEATRAYYKGLYEKDEEAKVESDEVPGTVVSAMLNYSGITKQAAVGDTAYGQKTLEDLKADDEISVEGTAYELIEEVGSDDATTTSPLSDGKPYRVTLEEFDANEPGYEQDVVTFFVKDKVVIDITDSKLTDAWVGKRIGFGNLRALEEGTMSVVYVRSDICKTFFEIAADKGSYAEVVQGNKP